MTDVGPASGERWIDIDNHYYEPDDAFTRHLAPQFADRSLHIVREGSGPGVPHFGAEPCYYLDRTPADLVGRPGTYASDREDRYRSLAEDELVVPGQLPWFVGREARLAWMDEHDIAAAVLWPSLGLTVEHQMRDDPDACVANLCSFNRWLDETWGFDYQGRLFAAPWLTLVDLDAAVRELDRVLAGGARVIAVLAAPVNGRSPADPYFDPFWARAAEAGVPVGFHAGESGLNETLSTAWGEQPRPKYSEQSPFQRTCATGDWPIMTTLASLVLHNLFGRFPGLQVLSVENGSAWASYLLSAMDSAARAGRHGQWLGGQLLDTPGDVFRAHVSIAPFETDDLVGLAELLGIDRVLFGSDYPHPEGLADPREFFAASRLTHPQCRQIGWTNPSRVLGMPAGV